MKHWKFRAAAIIVIIAALLTGTLNLVNDEPAGEGGASSALMRIVTTLTGGAARPAPAEPAATAAATEAPAPGATAAPSGSAISPVGSVNIAISGGDGDEGDGEEERVVGVSPNQRIPKDFHVDNQGAADVFVFMAVTVPYVNVATQLDDGTYQPAAARPLYSFRANPGWTLLEDSVASDRATYVYAYAPDRASAMTALKPGQSTGSLFDELVTVNYVEGRLDGAEQEVVAQAYAIQARNLGEGVDTPAAVWALVKNGEAGRGGAD